MVASPKNFPLIAELLAEQQRLQTPVAQFATAHDAGVSFVPQLIPLSLPGPGEQYAFEVDLDSCTGCKACVSACHSLNGLDDEETWRDVGLVVSPSRAHPFTQTVTTACHHCADPACLNGCPVLAYEKDPITGVVVHLDDQCIGCSYCVLKCPYDVPKFSERLGIVRKCDMCHSRLAAGEAPACAQACPTHAIKIVTVQSNVGRSATSGVDTSSFLHAAPDPSYTQPTTRYISSRPLPENLVAADATTLRVQPAHWPLVIMLTLLPAAVGLQIASLGSASKLSTLNAQLLPLAAAAAGGLGLLASVFHLGRPLRAWRIFLGWRKSWLSREAMVFGAWFPLTVLAAVAPHFSQLSRFNFQSLPMVTATIGTLGLVCSAMIYVDTRRHFWRAAQTFPRFFGTALVVAAACLAPLAAIPLLAFKLALESRTFFFGEVSARLQRGPLARAAVARDLCGLTALVLLTAAPVWLALAPLLAGELAERYLFFRAVDAPKMPGVPSA
ncbi:MAG: DmsC/YnfH family molybdoenzyme membrane anchor subunit [Opitutaceae bacterium]|nr:DmsC/YnfH family molybdoenzyme membrane anchor subunit [Opitutaceae bacterium]